MSSELNKVFGRDFLIGFFLPALFFSLGTFFLAKTAWPDAAWLNINWRKPFEDAGVFALGVWVFAIFLQSVNREMFRLVEGYWPWGLKDKCNSWQRKKFDKLKTEFEELYQKPDPLSVADEKKLNEISRQLATDYPSKTNLILPTSFGNAVRAYEDYSRVIYGFESIHGWTRLQGLISKDFREILDNDRARVDLWLNLFFLSLFFTLESTIVAGARSSSLLIPVLPLLAFAWFAYVRSRSSVKQFGEQVKAAFDIYLPELAGKLGVALSLDNAKNRQFWEAFSQVMVHRDAEALVLMLNAGLKKVPGATDASSKATSEEPESD